VGSKVSALEAVLHALESQPWPLQSRFTIHRNRKSATLERNGMQATIRETGDGQIGVAYDHALHEVTREQVSPEAAVRLLVMLLDNFERKQMGRVELPRQA
jgi:hypothetical protein